MKQTTIFGQAEGRFSMTDTDPLFGTHFYLEAVQLVNIDGEYTDWLPLEKICLDRYTEETLIPVGNNQKEWIKKKREISDLYCDGINYLTKNNITPFKQMASLKIRYLGEPKGKSHVFHYYAPRNP